MESGADDETRTRDPHLGKVMRYQLRYIRVATSYDSVRHRTLARLLYVSQISRSWRGVLW